MDKYRLVQEHTKGDGNDHNESSSSSNNNDDSTMSCEVRITQQGKPRNYISYAMKLFADNSDKIVLKAMGRAINKAVTIAEILKRKMPLHQCNALSSVEMVDIFEPLEEGLDRVTSRRYVSCMQITLSKSLEGIDVNGIGYQPPLPIEEMNPGDFHPLREAALIASS
mmetsp:Transcript_13552/g.28617  ORF Transcript_13552/g.28617 Transcript_13552/m.28617 type:complete len:167 (-) Transcript_13552:2042-2542(-)